MKNVIRFMLTFIVSLFVFASCNDFAKKSQVAVTASLEPVFSLVQPYFNQLNNSTEIPEVYYRFQSEVFYGDESVQKLIKEEPFSCDPNDKSWVNQTIFISDLEVGKEYKVNVEFSFVDYSSNSSTITEEGEDVANTTKEYTCAAGSVKFTTSSDPKQTEKLVLGFIRDISLTSDLVPTETEVLYSSSKELINFSAQASRKIDDTLEYLFRIAGTLEKYTVDNSELNKNFEWHWFVNSQELIPPSGDETFKLESVGNESNLFISFLKIWELGVDTSKPHYNTNGECEGNEFVVSCKISSSVTGYVYESNPVILYLKPPVDVQLGTNVVDYNADVNMKLVSDSRIIYDSVAENDSSKEFDKFYNATSDCIEYTRDKTLIKYTKIGENENFILSVNISDKENVEKGVISTIVGDSEIIEDDYQFNNPSGVVGIYIYKDGNELDLSPNSRNSFVTFSGQKTIVSTSGKNICFNIMFGLFTDDLDLQEHTITIKVIKSDTGVVIGTNTIKYQAVSEQAVSE